MIHCGFVGIIGLPNTGKSTLLNKVIGEKISIVSSKPQTTRQSLSGLLTEDDYQLVFFDAPGYVEAKKGLFQFLYREFEKVIEKSDVLLFLIGHDQRETPAFQKVLDMVKKSKKDVYCVFSKTDLEPTKYVEGIKSELSQVYKSMDFNVKDKDKLGELKNFLKDIAMTMPQEHHPLYDPEMISLDNTRDIVAEYIREECFLQLDKEIPYSLGVIIKSFKREKGLQRIEANIVIEKENHKAIVIGKNGQKLKNIGQASRKKIEELLGEKVFLGLHVAHKKNWQTSQGIMKELGYGNDK